MLIKATQKYTRQTPRKVRLVANAVKDLPLEAAFGQLAVIERKATMVVSQVLRQAVANATHNHGYQVADLAIDSIIVNEGPRYKRFRAVSRGRAHNVIKRTCHVTVTLKTAEEQAKVKKTEVVEANVETKAEPIVEAKVKAEPKKKVAAKPVAKKTSTSKKK